MPDQPLPSAPYYAVVFRSRRTPVNADYGETADRMIELARLQPGFLGVDSVRDASGAGITVSYWTSRDAIRVWRDEAEHRLAQFRGRNEWYESFSLEICLVEAARTWAVSANQCQNSPVKTENVDPVARSQTGTKPHT